MLSWISIIPLPHAPVFREKVSKFVRAKYLLESISLIYSVKLKRCTLMPWIPRILLTFIETRRILLKHLFPWNTHSSWLNDKTTWQPNSDTPLKGSHKKTHLRKISLNAKQYNGNFHISLASFPHPGPWHSSKGHFVVIKKSTCPAPVSCLVILATGTFQMKMYLNLLSTIAIKTYNTHRTVSHARGFLLTVSEKSEGKVLTYPRRMPNERKLRNPCFLCLYYVRLCT